RRPFFNQPTASARSGGLNGDEAHTQVLLTQRLFELANPLQDLVVLDVIDDGLLGRFDALLLQRGPVRQGLLVVLHLGLQRLAERGEPAVILYLAEVLFGLLQLPLHQSLADLELGHALQGASEAEPGAGPDQPLGRVPLIPADAIAIVPLKQVVIVVITLAPREQRQHAVVARCVTCGSLHGDPVCGHWVDMVCAVTDHPYDPYLSRPPTVHTD